MKKYFDDTWEENYKKNNALNKYSYGELVSVFFNSLKYLTTPVEDYSGEGDFFYSECILVGVKK